MSSAYRSDFASAKMAQVHLLSCRLNEEAPEIPQGLLLLMPFSLTLADSENTFSGADRRTRQVAVA